ncbi:hypothetical protein STCU_11901 [Strigomonas culicis]|uniref:Uncharacterized protein n=1 Tax=Strigomonas culicis TaxID=28005 RepID=S9TC85_9TRYP|nr:hypothetical protein STCU_11901 [Strigomonas culicis]|eukprot:EPY15592.1 hypothetical protein STCU_11901 [Strigomonas culicis]
MGPLVRGGRVLPRPLGDAPGRAAERFLQLRRHARPRLLRRVAGRGDGNRVPRIAGRAVTATAVGCLSKHIHETSLHPLLHRVQLLQTPQLLLQRGLLARYSRLQRTLPDLLAELGAFQQVLLIEECHFLRPQLLLRLQQMHPLAVQLARPRRRLVQLPGRTLLCLVQGELRAPLLYQLRRLARQDSRVLARGGLVVLQCLPQVHHLLVQQPLLRLTGRGGPQLVPQLLHRARQLQLLRVHLPVRVRVRRCEEPQALVELVLHRLQPVDALRHAALLLAKPFALLFEALNLLPRVRDAPVHVRHAVLQRGHAVPLMRVRALLAAAGVTRIGVAEARGRAGRAGRAGRRTRGVRTRVERVAAGAARAAVTTPPAPAAAPLASAAVLRTPRGGRRGLVRLRSGRRWRGGSR